ncbi:MAG: M24 family metallopeptidase [Candidatus Kapabacteria bacterium]|nr:M24 family metallopeptidase [Candidatus Kapabacteria bacterium]
MHVYSMDAWLLYDFRGSNSIAWKILNMPQHSHCTRRWAIVIPRSGSPKKIVHAIEQHTLSHLAWDEIVYSERSTWSDALRAALDGCSTVAMEYSPDCSIPVVSKVDAGTIELIRGLDKTVVSSADIAQHFQAVWSELQFTDNLTTATLLREAMMDAFDFLRQKCMKKAYVTEFDVQQNIVRFYQEHGLQSDSEPIVAIAKNASSPHYCPTPEINSPITIGDTVLIDMWAKSEMLGSTYADITWMAHCGTTVPERDALLFGIIRDARDAALSIVRERFSSGIKLYGYEVDDAARAVITNAGFGEYFIHRTGHNIGEETHGAGANMDNYETHDTREILRGTSFSIEPGIYIPNDIGLRTELDVVIDSAGNVLVPSEPTQDAIVALLA